MLAYFDGAFRNLRFHLEGDGRRQEIYHDHLRAMADRRAAEEEIAPAIAAAFGFVPGGVEATDRKNAHLPGMPVTAAQGRALQLP